jgi:hypothetical protein
VAAQLVASRVALGSTDLVTPWPLVRKVFNIYYVFSYDLTAIQVSQVNTEHVHGDKVPAWAVAIALRSTGEILQLKMNQSCM